MSTNYEQAKAILDKQGLRADSLYKEQQLQKAQALSMLALADEMKAARAPEVKEVFVLVHFHRESGFESLVMDVYRDRAEAYEERDRLNEVANKADAPVRYIIKEKTLL